MSRTTVACMALVLALPARAPASPPRAQRITKQLQRYPDATHALL